MKDNNINNNFIERIKNQKEAFYNWDKELKKEFLEKTKSPVKSMELYLVPIVWLKNYIQTFFNGQKNNNNLIKTYYNFELINNDYYYKVSTIKELPRLYPFDEKCWSHFNIDKEKELKFKGEFFNKILIFKLIIINSCNVYCFFFLDEKKDINQGYIKINQKDKENEILNNLIKIGPLEFINNLRNNNSNISQWLKSKYFDILFPEKTFIINHPLINPENTKIDITQSKIKNDLDQNYNEIKPSFIGSEGSALFSNLPLDNDNNTKNKNINLKNKNDYNSKIYNNEINKNNNHTNNNYIDKKGQILNPLTKIINNSKKRSLHVKRYFNDLNNLKIFNELLPNDDKNNNFAFFSPTKAIHREEIPGVIGLTNVGATCYMNSTLQCFSNLERLRKYLLGEEIYKDLEKNKQNKKISFALAEVLKNLWKVLNHRFYAPNNFKEIISEANDLFKGIAANDPKDLVLFILEEIHKELNKPNNQIIIHNNYANDHNFFDVYKDFMNDFNNKHNSIISDEFYGICYSETTCGNCKTVIYNVQLFNILFFPLEEVRKFMNYNVRCVRINECFEYYQKYELYPSFYCNSCRNDCQGYQQTRLVHTPKTIIINLNRGKGLQYDVKIIFEEYLNLAKYIIDKNSPYYYELTGIICHYGTNDMGGHFIAFCKNSNNAEWYKYNDQSVTKSSFNEARQSGLPYVLFYSYIQA